MAENATVGILRVLLTANTAEFDTAMKKASVSAKDLSRDLQKFGSAATSLGASLTAAITLPLAGVGAMAIKTGAEFEGAINQIQGVLSPTAAEMEKVRATAMQMGADTVFSATDAATAMLELGKAGLTTSQALESVDEVLQLAAASGLSMGEAAEMSARTLNAFGLQVADLSHVNDVLAKAVNTSSLEITDLQTAFRYIGPIAQGFGVSIEQATAALGVMRDAGIAAETSGRALREGLSRLANPVKAVKEVTEELGISLKDVDPAMHSLSEIVGVLQAKGLTAAQSLRLFGDAAGPGMFALVQKGRQGLDQLTEGLQKSDGAAKNMADAMMQGLPGALERFRGSVETAWLAISKAIEPTVIRILDGLGKMADFVTTTLAPAFMNLPAPVQAVAIGLLAVSAAAGPVLIVFGQLATAASSLIGLLGASGGLAGAATVAAGGMNALKVAALGVGQALAGATVVIGSGILVYRAYEQAQKLAAESTERASMAANESARRYAMMARAAEISGHSVHSYADAVAIVTEAARNWQGPIQKNVDTVTEFIGPLEQASTATKQLGDNSEESGKKVKKAAEDTTKAIRDYYNFVGERQMEDAAREMEAAEAKKAIWRDYYNWLGERRMEDDARAEESRRQQVFAESAKMGDMRGGFELHPPVEEVRATVGPSLGRAILGGIGDTFKTQFGPTIMQAITGGGNIGQAIGGLLGQSITGSLTGWLQKAAPAFMNSFLGNIVGSFLPGIGALLGPALGKIGDWFKGLFGVSKEVQQARTSLEDFQKTLRSTLTDTQKAEAGTEGWRQDVVRVRDAYLATGRTADQALAIVRQLWDTDHPEAMRAAMDEINRVLEEEKRLADDAAEAIRQQEQAFADAKSEATTLVGEMESLVESADGLPASVLPYIDKLLELGLITDEQAQRLRSLRQQGEVDWEAMRAAAERYGVDVDSLGGKFQGARIHASAQQIINDFGLLTRGGADVGGVLFGMRDEIAALVQDSIKFGTTIPRNMKPWIDELIRSNNLVDANGDKIEGLEDIKYGDELKDEALIAREGFAGIIAKLDELIAKITGPLNKALDDTFTDRTIDVGFHIQPVPIPRDLLPDINVPMLGKGGIVRQPTLAIVGESGPEAVIPLMPGLGDAARIQPVPIPDRWTTPGVFDRTDDRSGGRDSGGDRNVTMVPIVVMMDRTDDHDTVMEAVHRGVREGLPEWFSLDLNQLSSKLTPVIADRLGRPR